MEGTFNSIEQFEEVLYKTVEKMGENRLCKLMTQISPEENDKIKKLYDAKKIGRKIIKILEANPKKYIFTSKPDQDINSWVFKVAGTDNNNTQELKKKIVVKTKSNKDKKLLSEGEKKLVHQEKDVVQEKEPEVSDVKNNEQVTNKLRKTLKIAKESDELLDDSDELTSFEYKEEVFTVDEKLKKIVTEDMVLINNSFYISKYLVTQELYERVMGINPSSFKDDPEPNEKIEKRPVETISYLEAIEFCKKLSEKCGFASCYKKGIYTPEINGFRLPTESEWNFVATAENKNSYIYAGSDVPDGFAWYKHNSKTKTHEVGKKNPVMINDSDGIYDLNGNVWEWVMSDSNSDKAFFVGGSYDDSEGYLELGKPMNKDCTDKNTKNSKIGFRICVNSLK